MGCDYDGPRYVPRYNPLGDAAKLKLARQEILEAVARHADAPACSMDILREARGRRCELRYEQLQVALLDLIQERAVRLDDRMLLASGSS